MQVRVRWRGVSVASLREFLIRRPFRGRARRSFESTLHTSSRLAILSDVFRPSAGVAVFKGADDPALAKYRPQAIAGSLGQVLELARRIEAGELRLTVHHSVTVFVSLYTGRLDEEIRDFLWRVFQVPVFEQLRGPSFELLAWECEAHDGLHANGKDVGFEGGNDPVILEACSCGVHGFKWHARKRHSAALAAHAPASNY